MNTLKPNGNHGFNYWYQGGEDIDLWTFDELSIEICYN